MKVVVRITMALVAIAAFVLSFQSLTTLGEFAGYAALAPLYPVTVDLGTVSSCAAWLATRSRQAFWMTWTFLSVSVVQNAVVHWLMATGERPSWWLITLVATVPPATLGLVAHLGVSLSTTTDGPEISPNEINEVAEGDDTDQLSDLIDVDPLLERARELAVANGGAIGRPKLAAELDITDWKARQLLGALNSANGRGDAS